MLDWPHVIRLERPHRLVFKHVRGKVPILGACCCLHAGLYLWSLTWAKMGAIGTFPLACDAVTLLTTAVVQKTNCHSLAQQLWHIGTPRREWATRIPADFSADRHPMTSKQDAKGSGFFVLLFSVLSSNVLLQSHHFRYVLVVVVSGNPHISTQSTTTQSC